MCVFMCLHIHNLHMHICVHVGMHAHTYGGPRIALGITPQVLSIVLFETGSLTHLGLIK